MGREVRKTVRQMCERATWHFNRAFKEEGAPLLAEASDRSVGVLPDDDFPLFMLLNAYTQHLLVESTDYDRGIPALKRMLKMSEKMWGVDDNVSLSLSGQIAMFNHLANRESEAASAMLEFIARREAAGSKDDINYISVLAQLVGLMDDWLSENPEQGRKVSLFLVNDGRSVIGQDPVRLASMLEHRADWLAGKKFYVDAGAFV